MRHAALLLLPLALLVSGCGSQVSSAPHAKPPAQHKKKPTPPTPLPPALASAVAVTIDNQPAAWPQSGLSRADLVFEFPAEGGITRYLAVFWHTAAPKIGPVRSTRIYFDNVAAAYGWPFAHAGGNVDALRAIGPLGIKNIDQIYGSGSYFWRSTDRQMPHNLYTSTTLLEKAVHDDGYTPAAIPSFPKGEITGQATGGALITYADYPNIWVYEVGWNWQGTTWGRTIDGQAVVTQAGNAVTAKNVVIIYAPEFSDPDPYTVGAVNFTLRTGSGWLLENGQRKAISWTFGPGGFRFALAGGTPAPFLSGQTWIEVLPTGTPLSFNP